MSGRSFSGFVVHVTEFDDTIAWGDLMWFAFNTNVWFYRQAIDFRKRIDGVVILVADTLANDPTRISKHLTVIQNVSHCYFLNHLFSVPGLSGLTSIVDSLRELSIDQCYALFLGFLDYAFECNIQKYLRNTNEQLTGTLIKSNFGV